MKKKITIDQLIPDMYVSNLHCPWRAEGQRTLEGRVGSQNIVDQLKQRGISELYIDISRGLDVPPSLLDDEPDKAKDKEKQRLIEEISEQVEEIEIKVDVRNEINQALSIYQQARELMNKTLRLVRAGKPIDAKSLVELADKMAASISRNPSALMCIGCIRNKENYLTEHSVNSGVMMGAFSLYQRLNEEQSRNNILAGLLHDMTMVLVPDEIMQKTQPLSEKEFKQIKMHVDLAKEILSKTTGISKNTVRVVAEHHERVDGKGYPKGLKANQICDAGKMIAIGDMYDAITAERVYSRSLPPTTGMKKLLDVSGTHLDTKLVHRFIKIMGVYPVGSLVRLNNDKLGIVMQAGKLDYRAPLVKVIYSARTKRYLPVEWLDLAAPLNLKYKIEEAVHPAAWGISVEDFLS